MKYTVTVVTGTRADYGLLRELLFRLRDNDSIKLDLVVTGSHLSNLFGSTREEIIKDGFSEHTCIPLPIEDDTKSGMARTTGVAVEKFADYFAEKVPDVVVVLGDRYEIFSAVIAAHFQGIPVAHISGGDVTEGAIDDSIRHSITKMSQIHFPGCEQSKNRIIQMGEQPNTVFNVGELGVENCIKMNLMSREELEESVQWKYISDSYAIVTFHPVTLEDNTGLQQVNELIRAMNEISELSFIITMANADAGGRAINDLWISEGKKHDNWLVVSSLGVKRYLSAMKYSKMVIGNSSSGIVEAPAMGVPTINIGDRQKGRMMASSVLSCPAICDEIVTSVRNALDGEFISSIKDVISPFGDGNTSMLIEKELMSFLKCDIRSIEKHFYDLKAD